MARYFFNLINGLTVEDVDGVEFDLVAEARGHALKVAQELGRHGSPLGGRCISVTDEKGLSSSRRRSPTTNRPLELAADSAANHWPPEHAMSGPGKNPAVMVESARFSD